ncbi:kinase-like protein [Stipitochalara longipes BDJ]|nr:kinase-like protein [Stipitochalara longipes BDJ]
MSVRVPRIETLNYRPGGFHPVHLNDSFKKERYTVIHKLGHGGFATVWLARDKVRERYVALKILAARLSRDCPEVEILRRLRNSEESIGKAFVMSMLDHFWIDGPNGHHLCVVSEVGGPSIKQFNECPGLKSGSRRLRGEVARKVALQAAEGLAYIHSTGTVHGDFTAANILLQLANIDEWTVDQIHERLGKPMTQDLHRTPGGTEDLSGPRYTISTIDMKLVDPQWISDQIMIIDFGIAFLQEHSSVDIGTPKAYCAPEFNFGCPRSVHSDTWALGCTIFEIRTGACLFRFRGVPTRDQVLVSMVQLLGKLPEKWWVEWEDGHNWYDIEVQVGGEMAESAQGNLHHQIMQIGMHDGDIASDPSLYKNHDLKHETVIESESEIVPTTSQAHHDSTNRLVALVEELTTSEAADVIAQINNPQSSGSSHEKTISGSSEKNNSGSAVASGSSNAKSGEKSISSEGISTGVPGVPVTSGDPPAERPISDSILGSISMPVTLGIAEFLEPTGTIISPVEANSLETLLREALIFLPELRVTPLELTKQHWFRGIYENTIHTHE